MNKKTMLYETIFTIIILAISVIIFYPREEKTFGSSEKLVLSIADTANFFEIDEDNIQLGIMCNKKNIITALIFYTPNTLIFYNQNIEGKNINIGMDNIIEILKNNKYLKDNTINIVRYKGEYKFDNKYSINEKKDSLESLATKYGINSKDEKEILQEIYYKSKEFSRSQNSYLKTVKKKSDYAYEKLLNYVSDNNIVNEDINSHKLDIILVPLSEEANNYPTNNSYYYVKDGLVYAYIEINLNENIYSYCYNGSIEEYRMGKC